jgi:hypothetical protein
VNTIIERERGHTPVQTGKNPVPFCRNRKEVEKGTNGRKKHSSPKRATPLLAGTEYRNSRMQMLKSLHTSSHFPHPTNTFGQGDVMEMESSGRRLVVQSATVARNANTQLKVLPSIARKACFIESTDGLEQFSLQGQI